MTKDLKTSVQTVDKECSDWALIITITKTMVPIASRIAESEAADFDLHVLGVAIATVDKSKHLGSMFTNDGTLDTEISHCICWCWCCLAQQQGTGMVLLVFDTC